MKEKPTECMAMERNHTCAPLPIVIALFLEMVFRAAGIYLTT